MTEYRFSEARNRQRTIHTSTLCRDLPFRFLHLRLVLSSWYAWPQELLKKKSSHILLLSFLFLLSLPWQGLTQSSLGIYLIHLIWDNWNYSSSLKLQIFVKILLPTLGETSLRSTEDGLWTFWPPRLRFHWANSFALSWNLCDSISVKHCFSNFHVHTNHPRTLLKRRSQVSKISEDRVWDSLFPGSFQVDHVGPRVDFE